MARRLMSPAEVRAAPLGMQFFGYDCDQVDLLLDDCADSITVLWRTNRDLSKENHRLHQLLNERNQS